MRANANARCNNPITNNINATTTQQVVSSEQMQKGFARLAEALEDTLLDVPDAVVRFLVLFVCLCSVLGCFFQVMGPALPDVPSAVVRFSFWLWHLDRWGAEPGHP